MKCLGKYWLFVAGCLLLVNNLIGQHCSVVLTSDTEFKIALNRKAQHKAFTKQLRINNLTANNKYYAEISFKNDSTMKRTTLFLLDEGFLHFYEVSKKGLQLKKIIPEASYRSTKEIKTVTYQENKILLPEDTVKTDTSALDTAYVAPFANYYHLEDYKGKIGCPFPIKEEKLAELKTIMLNENLEEVKLEKVKTAITNLDSVCVLLDQVKELAMLFEYEETKLEFSKFMSPYFFDIDNVGKLEEVFNFENSMVELKEYIGTQIAKPDQK